MSDIELHATAVSELEAYMRQAEMLARSTLVPANYRNKPADILVASLAGREVGMGPWAALTYVVVINGKATINAEGRVALIRKAGHSVSGESTPERAVAHGKRRDTGDEMTVEWTIDMAKRAGLVKSGPWTQYPEAMLWARAVSQLSRMLFADVLMGVSYDPEELGARVDRDGQVIDVEVTDDVACTLCGDLVAGARSDVEAMRLHRQEVHGWVRRDDGTVAPPQDVPAALGIEQQARATGSDDDGTLAATPSEPVAPSPSVDPKWLDRITHRLDQLPDEIRRSIEDLLAEVLDGRFPNELVPADVPTVNEMVADGEAAVKSGSGLAARAARNATRAKAEA